MKNPHDLLYATKVWLFSVFTSPILFLLASVIFDGSSRGDIGGAFNFFGILILFGFLFSFPSWILFMIGVRHSDSLSFISNSPKVIIQVIAIVLCVLPFAFLFGGAFGNPEVLLFAIPYLITLSIGIWYFELKPREVDEVLTIDDLVE